MGADRLVVATGGITPRVATRPTYDQAMADQGSGEPATMPAEGPSLVPGTHVEVQSGFDESWQRGFVVEEVTPVGYRLRRESDGQVLPELPHERVRKQRSRSTWWV
jgi:hypothetical protein